MALKMANQQDRMASAQNSRREFVKAALALGAAASLSPLRAQSDSTMQKSHALFEGYAIPPRQG